jgi:hypothetical protein
VTAHFVIYRDKVFGISVAHTPCYIDDIVPAFINACPKLDVSIWSGFPPDNIHLLNITGSVAVAKIGDVATAFGFADDERRAWKGYISKFKGNQSFEDNIECRHFTPFACSHPKELLFAGSSQTYGMSGGGVMNGKGKGISKPFGIALMYKTDSVVQDILGCIQHNLAIVVPFAVYRDCIENLPLILENYNGKAYRHPCSNII